MGGGDIPRQNPGQPVQRLVPGIHQRQMQRIRHPLVAHQQHARTAFGEAGGELQRILLITVGRSEKQHRKTVMHNRHRPVPHLGGGERLALQLTRFLALQRRLLRHRQTCAAPDHKQPLLRPQHFNRCSPIRLRRLMQPFRQGVQRLRQRRTTMPMCQHPQR